jgi:membrane protease YdiL (CAAX protease family)
VKNKLLSLVGITGALIGYYIGIILIGLPLNSFFTPPQNEYLRIIIIYGLLLPFTVFYHLLIIKIFGKKEKSKHGLELVNRWALHFVFSMTLAVICISIIWSLAILFNGFNVSFNVLSTEAFVSIGLLLIMMLLAGFMEEILARGTLAFIGKRGGKWFSAIIISAITIIRYFESYGVEDMNIVNLVNIFLFSIAAFQLFWYSGNLWSVAGFYFGWNFIAAGVYGVSTRGVKAIGFLISETETGNYINGGEYGLQGSILSTIVLITLIIFLIIMNKRHKIIK